MERSLCNFILWWVYLVIFDGGISRQRQRGIIIISEDDHNDNNSDGSSDGENHDPNVENAIPQETVCAALLLIKSQPLKKAMRKVRTKKRTEDEVEGYKFEMEEHLHNLLNLPFCFSPYRMHFTSCRCLHSQRENCLFPAVAARLGTSPFFFLLFFFIKLTNFLVSFADYPQNVCETILKERIVATKDHGKELKKVRRLLTNQRGRGQQNQMFC
jgi:hypothetical protein